MELTLDPRAFPGVTHAERITVADDDLGAANTLADPDRVLPLRTEVAPGARLSVELPPVSWNLIRLTF